MGRPPCDGCVHGIPGERRDMILSARVDRIVGFSLAALLKHRKNNKNHIETQQFYRHWSTESFLPRLPDSSSENPVGRLLRNLSLTKAREGGSNPRAQIEWFRRPCARQLNYGSRQKSCFFPKYFNKTVVSRLQRQDSRIRSWEIPHVMNPFMRGPTCDESFHGRSHM